MFILPAEIKNRFLTALLCSVIIHLGLFAIPVEFFPKQDKFPTLEVILKPKELKKKPSETNPNKIKNAPVKLLKKRNTPKHRNNPPKAEYTQPDKEKLNPESSKSSREKSPSPTGDTQAIQAPGKNLTGTILLNRSLHFIHNQVAEESKQQKQLKKLPKPIVSLSAMDILKAESSDVDIYTTPEGNKVIRLTSKSGKVSCYEFRPPDPLKSFDYGAFYGLKCK